MSTYYPFFPLYFDLSFFLSIPHKNCSPLSWVYLPHSMSVCPLIDVRVNELLSFHLLFCYAGCQTQYRRHQTGKVKIAGEDAFKHHIFLSVSNIFTSLDFLLTLGSAKGSNTSYYSFNRSCRFSFHFSFFVCLYHISKRSIFFYAEYV